MLYILCVACVGHRVDLTDHTLCCIVHFSLIIQSIISIEKYYGIRRIQINQIHVLSLFRLRINKLLFLQLSKVQRDSLGKAYKTSRSRRLIEQRLLSFLNYNNYHLPMFAKPGLV